MSVAKKLVHVLNLRRMGFVQAHDIQMRFARYHLDEIVGKKGGHGYNIVLITEHNPIYTVGLRDKGYSKEDEAELKAKGAEFYRTNRGGLITYHGPGQLVAYPILNLKHFRMGIRDYVSTLEDTMIKTCKNFGLSATTTEDTGVWIGEKKIGAIGIHGSRYVTTHGISLNCNTDLSWFKHIVPCGIEGKDVTSISRELRKNVTVQDCIPNFLDAFQQKFDCEVNETFLKGDEMNLLPTKQNLESVEKRLLDAETNIGKHHKFRSMVL